MRHPLIAVAAALSLVAGTAHAAVVTYGGSEYQVVTTASDVDWLEARAQAQVLPGGGWDLATVGDVGENDFLVGLLSLALPERSHFWIGATDVAVEGSWQWIDATPWVYANWHGGEPNNSGGVEHYLAYDLRGGVYRWNDVPLDLKAAYPNQDYVVGFIAERPIPVPAALPLLLAGLAGFGVFARRRAGS